MSADRLADIKSDIETQHSTVESFLDFTAFNGPISVRDGAYETWLAWEDDEGDWWACRPRGEDDGPSGDPQNPWVPIGPVALESLPLPLCVNRSVADADHLRWLIARVDALTADRLADIKAREQQPADEWRHVGACDGCAYTEPEETCPMHGRTLVEWRDIASDQIRRANRAEAEVQRLRDTVARLNRRCQKAEAAINHIEHGTGKGRMPELRAELWERGQELIRLRAVVARVEALCVAAETPWTGEVMEHPGPLDLGEMIEDLRAALAEPTATETDHTCTPVYWRSKCGECGDQEQSCETCSRPMCRCAPTGQEATS